MVDGTDFQNAKDTLKPHDVFIKETSCFTRSDFEPRQENLDSLVCQFMHVVKESEVVGVQDDEGNEEHFFKVYVGVGCRFIKEEEKGVESAEAVAQIEAVFCSEYLMLNKDLGEDELRAFALQNASYHIWPFWREYLMNMCNRLNLPKVVLPSMQVK